MLNIVIVDDEKDIAALIEEEIYDISMKKNILVNVEVFYSGKSYMTYFNKEPVIDIIFLDIEMPGLNGVDIAKEIRKIDQNVLLIYVSSHDEYLLDLFEVEPYRYIQKPFKRENFEEIFCQAYRRVIAASQYFEYQYNKYYYKVRLNDIVYFESNNRTIIIHKTNKKEEVFYGKLNNVECKVSDSKIPFLRIHQSYLINFLHIKRINFSNVVMKNNVALTISKDKRKDLREYYHQLLNGYL